MFDKHALNNQITANQISMRRAKVYVINKLVKKCRKLKAIMNKNPNEKTKKKIDRITEQISAVKKLKCLDTLKKALLNEIDPKKVISKGTASNSEIAEMLIFSTKVVVDIVQRLKTIFSLDTESNKDWKDKFVQSKRKSKKKPATTVKQETDPDEATPSIRNETYATNPFQSKQEVDEEKQEVDEEKQEVDEEKHEIEESAEVQQKIIRAKKIKKKPQKSLDDEFLENDLVESNSVDTKFVSMPDPFFTTPNGQNYMSTVYVDNEADENEGSDNDESFSNHRQNSYRKYNKNIGVINNQNSFQQNEENYDRNKDFEMSNRNLHPSWQAKQKIKPVIQEFTGKKITFDGNNDHQVQSNDTNVHPSWQAKQKMKPIIKEFTGKKIKFDDGNAQNTDSNLHPSWQAKQNSKPIVHEFKGKKTSFDNAGTELNIKKPEPNLHPSWQAKQKLKPIIQEFKGQKKTFDF